MRDQILKEIRRIAKENGGKPPGVRLFEHETGITQGAWRGVYWIRWSEAIIEAGLLPNDKTQKLSEEFVFKKLADVVRRHGKMPTMMDLRMYRKTDPDFPNDRTIQNHFKSKDNMVRRLVEWAAKEVGYQDLVEMLPVDATPNPDGRTTPTKEGFVYLIKSGAHYKIGKSGEIERRIKEIRVALPESAKLIHSIRTDDPEGIEAYWHRRFADRRANGEWFRLSPSDVKAFKRRKFQ